jgi:hypothetical protein
MPRQCRKSGAAAAARFSSNTTAATSRRPSKSNAAAAAPSIIYGRPSPCAITPSDGRKGLIMKTEGQLPPLPPNSPGVNDHVYKPRQGVILVCPDERSQQQVYETLNALKTCKIKVVCA